MKSLDQLPPFSPVLNHLMATLADEDVSFARLADLIERDTVLSGNVLRLVNSALYGRRGNVSSVRAAVSILGLYKLRNFLLGLSVSRLWSRVKTPDSWSMARFNEHAIATALLADRLVQKLPAEYPEGAFAAGLLHDLGRLMIATALPEEFLRIRAMRVSSGKLLEQCEYTVIDSSHAELSAAALGKWNLPAPIQKAALYHHHPELDPGRHAAAATLSLVVSVANDLANSAGHAISEEDEKEAPPPQESLSRLKLAQEAENLLAALEEDLQHLKSSF
ncbi:MAG: HDOD domain-containing protein [Bryobacteraceae bacterium]